MATMTRSERIRENAKTRVLAMLEQFPGTIATNLPQAQRAVLRDLELAGKIKYCNGGHGEGWYLK